MKRILGFVIFLLLLSSQAGAARDPIAWSLDHRFPSTVLPGRTYTVTYTFTSQLPSTMVHALAVSENASPAADFTYTDHCSGQKLTPGQTCTVQVQLVPSTAGNKSVQLTLGGYDNNRLLIPLLTTAATGSQTQTVTGYPTNGFTNSATAGITQNYLFTFTNYGTSALTNTSVTVTQSSGTPSYTTTCITQPPSGNKGTCTVSGAYTPVNGLSVQTVTAILNYGQGSSASTSTSTNVSSTTGIVASFIGGNEKLPQIMNAGTATIGVLYTNYGPANYQLGPNTTPMVVTVGGSVGSIIVTTNNCQNIPLNAPTTQNPTPPACNIVGTFTATTPGTDTPVTLETTLAYGAQPSGPYTSTSVIDTSTVVAASTLTTARTVTLVNNCSFPLWWSLNGANYSTACTTNADCTARGTGTSCSSITNTCFWTNYAPNGPGSSTGTNASAYKLDGTSTVGGVYSNTVTIAASTTDPSILWSGSISASLNCNGTSCVLGDCQNSGGTTGCTAGKGFGLPGTPVTQAEFTLQKNTVDNYDVEVINGYHIPIGIQPVLPLATPVNVTANGYSCGAPGNFIATNGFGSCDWSTALVPTQYGSNYPGNGYYLVTSGGAACDITTGKTTPGGSSCSAGTVCGLDPSYNAVCGNFLGYRTADQVCGDENILPAGSNISSYFQCTTNLATLDSSLFTTGPDTLKQLMLCSVPTGDVNTLYNSCYLAYPGVLPNPQTGSNQSNCCGCIDWWTLGIGANNTATSCTVPGQATPQTDPVWNTYIQYGVQWLKKACPSAYVYPFDDKTSGFSCTDSTTTGTNSTGYTITFCPGNNGLPSSVAGLVDGRV